MNTMCWVVKHEYLKSLGPPPPPPAVLGRICIKVHSICKRPPLWVSGAVLNITFGELSSVLISHQSHYTNSRNNLYVPRSRLDLFKTSTSFVGATLWNSLPQNIKSLFLFPVSDVICTNIGRRITFHQIWTDLFESHLPKNVSVIYVYHCMSMKAIWVFLHICRNSVKLL